MNNTNKQTSAYQIVSSAEKNEFSAFNYAHKIASKNDQQSRNTIKFTLIFTYLIIIYLYLYAFVFYGYPFLAFDHLNYVIFLNNPSFFYFEPVYTLAAYLVNFFFSAEMRFPVIFLIFTLPPLLIALRSSKDLQNSVIGIYIFACIVTKSFYVGLIAQRFFFAELWLCAAILHYVFNKGKFASILFPGMLQFSALTTLPSIIFINSKLNFTRILVYALGLFSFAIYLKFFSSFQLMGYDYSRYIEGSEERSGFPLLSLIQIGFLLVICTLILPKTEIFKFFILIIFISTFRIMFAEIEVFSRIFQIQIDLIIIYACLKSPKFIWIMFLYCLGFLILQIFFTQTALEVGLIHENAIQNIRANLFS
jgi:hypothetical protein